jgi:hypothetical protein
MSSFMHEHWKWIVGSIVLVVVAIVLIMLFSGGQDMSPFQYGTY